MRPDVLAPILDVAALEVVYFGEAGPVAAVRDVSFRIARQETLGLVGESGSGKSSIGLAIARQLPDNSRITKGSIRFDDIDLVQVEGRALRKARGHRIAMVYQDPSGALNPSLRIGQQIAEVYHASGERDPRAGRDRVISMLERVRLPDAAYAYERYPHEFSGGQQQRIVIAMALAMNPDLLILDEPTTGLDVSVEAEILDLFAELRRSLNAGILFISHNIAVIAKMCDQVGTLHDGRIVELGPTEEVLRRPSHPYTRALLAARIPFGATKPAAVQSQQSGVGSDRLESAGNVALVEVRKARKSYRARGRRLQAVAGVDFQITKGKRIRHRGRIWFREDDSCTSDRRPPRSRHGHCSAPRPRHNQVGGMARPGHAERHSDGVPESQFDAQPQTPDRGHFAPGGHKTRRR